MTTYFTDQVTTSKNQDAESSDQIENFLKEIYTLSSVGETDDAGFKIFDELDQLPQKGQFDLCDEMLKRIDVDLLDTKLMRSFLSITFPAKSKLSETPALFKRIETKMIQIRGEGENEQDYRIA